MREEERSFIQEIKNNEGYTDVITSAIMFLGSVGFLIAGISSYMNQNLIEFLNAKEIIFFPQGITMCFYGLTGLIISSYQIIILKLKVGEGYNKLDREKGTLTIYRNKFPWQKEEIFLTYSINDIEAIRVERNNTILNSKQTIFICLRGKKEIPIIQIRRPININEFEKKASDLASILKVPIRGI
uniref:Photosystem I assembly protein Ycf4 n=1 Tax=Lepocinclis playfairiana TaxID=1403386 RepID=A0A3G3LLG6_9EUGL|nr:photosystem I assembly protein ycf4 [Lepocinclis playfairiana]AYQ93550.1 photosystem I assembly protein ycf4 [Lepocinclis playfairiana]